MQKRLHTDVFTHRSVCTQKLSHTEASTHRSFYTKKLLHTEAFTHRSFYTQEFLHTYFFLHTEAFTHKCFYTQKRLHTEAFTHRSFYEQKHLHTEAFTHRSFYIQEFLHKEVCTRFYTEKLLHTEASQPAFASVIATSSQSKRARRSQPPCQPLLLVSPATAREPADCRRLLNIHDLNHQLHGLLPACSGSKPTLLRPWPELLDFTSFLNASRISISAPVIPKGSSLALVLDQVIRAKQ